MEFVYDVTIRIQWAADHFKGADKGSKTRLKYLLSNKECFRGYLPICRNNRKSCVLCLHSKSHFIKAINKYFFFLHTATAPFVNTLNELFIKAVMLQCILCLKRFTFSIINRQKNHFCLTYITLVLRLNHYYTRTDTFCSCNLKQCDDT